MNSAVIWVLVLILVLFILSTGGCAATDDVKKVGRYHLCLFCKADKP